MTLDFKRETITLGNVMSMLVTVITMAIGVAGIMVTYEHRLTVVEDNVTNIKERVDKIAQFIVDGDIVTHKDH